MSNKVKHIQNEPIITLLEDEDYMVITELKKLQIHIITFMKNYPNSFSFENKLLLNNINNTLKSNVKIINAKTICSNHDLNYCLRNHAITMLEIGKCQVLNKKTCEIIKDVKIKEYGYQLGPLCGQGGRIFLIEDKEFISVMDWIS